MRAFLFTTLNNIHFYSKKQWPIILVGLKKYIEIFLLYSKKQWPIILVGLKKYIEIFLFYSKTQLLPVFLFIFNYFLFTIWFLCLYLFFISKDALVRFYNHVIIVTAAEAERIEILAKNNIQKQKAPSLLLLKLDFLAFFSILNRVFSLILVIFLLCFFSFIFIYNVTILAINKFIFFFFILFVLVLIIHIGFSHIKMALVFENFCRLISNKIANIRKFYFIIYLYLFLVSFVFLILLLVLFFKIQMHFDLFKFFYFSSCVAVFLQEFYSTTNTNVFFYYNFCLYLLLFLFNYYYFCKFLLNYRNLLIIILKFVCFCKSLSFIIQFYYAFCIHSAIYLCPQYWPREPVYLRDKITGAYNWYFLVNPDWRMYGKIFAYCRYIVGDAASRLWFLGMFKKLTVTQVKSLYTRIMEATYAIIVLRFYKILCICVQSPKQSVLLVKQAEVIRCLWLCLLFLKTKTIYFRNFKGFNG